VDTAGLGLDVIDAGGFVLRVPVDPGSVPPHPRIKADTTNPRLGLRMFLGAIAVARWELGRALILATPWVSR
jgi:hypothetical protein